VRQQGAEKEKRREPGKVRGATGANTGERCSQRFRGKPYKSIKAIPMPALDCYKNQLDRKSGQIPKRPWIDNLRQSMT
jgi:hypothetical protein